MDRRWWITAVVSVGVLAGCGGGSSTGGLDAQATYAITLTTTEVVPAPKPSTATGGAAFIVYPDRISYQIAAQFIVGVNSVHIHTGAPGVAGAAVLTIFSTTSPVSPIGPFATGTILPGNLPAGMTIEYLRTLFASGNAYVDIHTTANIGGELRGQIK